MSDKAPQSRSAILRSELSKEIASFNNDRRENKRKAFRLKISGTLFSAVTTILLGLQSFGASSIYFKDVALVLSTFVTVFSAWDSFYNHRGLWIHYRTIYRRLKTVEASLNYLIGCAGGNEPPTEEVDKLFKRFEEIMDESTRSWLELRNGNSANAT